MTPAGPWDGANYDRTRRADPRLVAELGRHLGSSRGAPCLDLACGTGNYTIALAGALAGRGLAMVGLDAAEAMLARGRLEAPELMWVRADAARLPFDEAIFGASLCTLAIHHFDDLDVVFAEVARVQRSGRLVLFTAWPEQMRAYWLDHYFPKAMARSVTLMPERGVVLHALDEAGFRVVEEAPWRVPPDPVDLFLYAGKHRPELYLDPKVRAGISTFTGLADATELKGGLARLEADIASGRIDEVIAAHSDQGGDYVVVVCQRERP